LWPLWTYALQHTAKHNVWSHRFQTLVSRKHEHKNASLSFSFCLCFEGVIENMLIRNYSTIFPMFNFKYFKKRKCMVLYTYVIKVGAKFLHGNK
jgi:hypothetical protein